MNYDYQTYQYDAIERQEKARRLEIARKSKSKQEKSNRRAR